MVNIKKAIKSHTKSFKSTSPKTTARTLTSMTRFCPRWNNLPLMRWGPLMPLFSPIKGRITSSCLDSISCSTKIWKSTLFSVTPIPVFSSVALYSLKSSPDLSKMSSSNYSLILGSASTPFTPRHSNGPTPKSSKWVTTLSTIWSSSWFLMRHQTESNWKDCMGLKRASETKLVRWKRRRRSMRMMALKRRSGMRTKIHELIVPEVPFDN